MWTFEPEPDGPAFVARLDPAERAVILDAVDDVIELLGGRDDEAHTARAAGHPLDGVRLEVEPVPAPLDAALLRLLPDASREDPEVSAEFRRLTEGDLRTTKVANLMRLRAVVAGALPAAVVLASEAPGVAAALTDLRLVISERLGLETDEDADAVTELATQSIDDGGTSDLVVRRFLATLYVVLSVLQESLVELMLAGLPDGDDPADPSAGPDAAPPAPQAPQAQ